MFVLLPVVGILALGWDWREVIVLYWLENITVGVLNVVAMIRTRNLQDTDEQPTVTVGGSSRNVSTKAGLVPFFILHYGIFTAVHGVFVFFMISGWFSMFGRTLNRITSVWFGEGSAVSTQTALEPLDFVAIIGVWAVGSIVQLVVSLFTPRDDLPSVGELFTRPYRRIITLHLTIIVAAWLITRFDWPPIAALLLVALHVITDLWSSARPGNRGRTTAYWY